MEELYDQEGWLVTKETSDPMPDGRTKTTIRVNNVDSASIIAINKDGNVLLLREYRPFWGDYIWMLPSGKVDKEKDHNVAALRELQEETGYGAKDIQPYFVFNFNERIKITHHLYIAKDLYSDPLPQDDDELIELHELPLDQAIENVLSSPRIHAASAIGLLRYTREF